MPRGRNKKTHLRQIIAECYTEDALAKALGFSRNMVNHQSPAGRDKVLDSLHTWSETKPAVGLIDEDHKDNPKLKDYIIVSDFRGSFSFQVSHSRTGRSVWFVMVLPNFEEWFLNNCKRLKINILDYGLPNDTKSWKNFKTKGFGNERKLEAFNSLVSDLAKRKNSFIKAYYSQLKSILKAST